MTNIPLVTMPPRSNYLMHIQDAIESFSWLVTPSISYKGPFPIAGVSLQATMRHKWRQFHDWFFFSVTQGALRSVNMEGQEEDDGETKRTGIIVAHLKVLMRRLRICKPRECALAIF